MVTEAKDELTELDKKWLSTFPIGDSREVSLRNQIKSVQDFNRCVELWFSNPTSEGLKVLHKTQEDFAKLRKAGFFPEDIFFIEAENKEHKLIKIGVKTPNFLDHLDEVREKAKRLGVMV
jgi:hypothetical protein